MRYTTEKQTDTKYYHYYNANPKSLKACDCVVRSIAVAEDKSWDSVYMALTMLGFERKRVFEERILYEEYLKQLGYKQIKRYNGKHKTAVDLIKQGVFDDFSDPVIAELGSDHIAVFKRFRGVYRVWDSWDSSECEVGLIWVKK